MTGTDFCVNKPHMSRSYLNHLVYNRERDINSCLTYRRLLIPLQQAVEIDSSHA